ncbi:hypothetical protein, partial [Leuconostoc citreum]|uniref:hypothetical protein n=1 Tax=Leuconostoc citreum TaxID=33964 RepID=UPI001659CC5B
EDFKQNCATVFNNVGLFQKASRTFVQMLMVYGEVYTKDLLTMKPKDFNRKMDRLIKYVKDNRNKFSELESAQYKRMIQSLGQINKYLYLVSNDIDVTEYLNENKDSQWLTSVIDKKGMSVNSYAFTKRVSELKAVYEKQVY